MALATIKHTERLPAGAVPADITARLRLIASTTGRDHGFVTAAAHAIAGDRVQHPDATGTFTFTSVNPNVGASEDVVDLPSGTRYGLSIWQRTGTKDVRIGTELVLLVQDVEEEQWSTDILSDVPGSLLAPGAEAAIAGEAALRAAADAEIEADPRWTNARRPLPLGSRMIALGDSITIGTGSTLASGVSITGDSRQAPGGWFSRMCGQYPNRYYKVRNAGIGGDPVGGIGTLTAPVAAGANTFTIRLTNGLKPYSTAVGFYVGGYPSGEGKFASSIVDNGDGTYTYTLTGTLASAHAAGAPVGWGMHGRLQSDVIDWAPETVPVLAGTNDSTGITNGTVTATAVGAAVAELGARLRTAGIEPLFLEVLPRSTNQAAVVRLNDALAQECRAGSYHLVPTYRVFAGGDGGWASGTYTADGTHPSDLGHQMLADTVHGYLVGVPLRITSTPLAAYDTDPTNLFANACFLTGSAGGGGIVPASVTFTPFVFAGTCVPNIEDPAAGDGITGKWATLTGTNLNGNAAFDLPVTAQSVGDLVYLAARVKTTGMGGGATAIVQFLTGSFTIDLAYQVVDDFDATLMVTTTRLAAVSLSKLRIQLLGTGGSNGKLWVAQPLMRNLTTLGRAA